MDDNRIEKLYSYVLASDNNFSPCVCDGILTLACCKPVIRSSIYAEWQKGKVKKPRIGVLACHNTALGKKWAYFAIVDEVIPFEEYYNKHLYEKYLKRGANSILAEKYKSFNDLDIRKDHIYKLKNGNPTDSIDWNDYENKTAKKKDDQIHVDYEQKRKDWCRKKSDGSQKGNPSVLISKRFIVFDEKDDYKLSKNYLRKDKNGRLCTGHKANFNDEEIFNFNNEIEKILDVEKDK